MRIAAASPWATSDGDTRPNVRTPLGCVASGISSPPSASRVRSSAPLPAETWSSPASLVIGSDVRVAPESSSPT